MSAKKAPPLATAVRGSGRPNVLYIQDFATGESIFRVETDVRRTSANRKDFDALVALVGKKKRTPAEKKMAITIAKRLVTGMGRAAADARRAKEMFKAALTF